MRRPKQKTTAVANRRFKTCVIVLVYVCALEPFPFLREGILVSLYISNMLMLTISFFALRKLINQFNNNFDSNEARCRGCYCTVEFSAALDVDAIANFQFFPFKCFRSLPLLNVRVNDDSDLYE
jgi:hypothetical protein